MASEALTGIVGMLIILFGAAILWVARGAGGHDRR